MNNVSAINSQQNAVPNAYLIELAKQKKQTLSSLFSKGMSFCSPPPPRIEVFQEFPIEVLELIGQYIDEKKRVKQLLSLARTELSQEMLKPYSPADKQALQAIHEKAQEKPEQEILIRHLPFETCYHSLCIQQFLLQTMSAPSQNKSELDSLKPVLPYINKIKLPQLKIENNVIFIQKLSLVFNACLTITDLNLSGCELLIEKIPLQLLHHLKKLNLSRNYANSISSLETYNNGAITAVDVSYIAQKTPFDRTQLQCFLKKFPNISSLKILSLPYGNITFFEDVALLKNLKRLNLCNTVPLTALQYTELKKLQSLHMSCPANEKRENVILSPKNIVTMQRAIPNLQKLWITGAVERCSMALLSNFSKLSRVAIHAFGENPVLAVPFAVTDTVAQRREKLLTIYESIHSTQCLSDLFSGAPHRES